MKDQIQIQNQIQNQILMSDESPLMLERVMEERECGKEETKDWQTHASVKQTDIEGMHLSWCGVGFLDGTVLILL